MLSDAGIRNASRLLTLLAFVTFLGWLFLQDPVMLLVAILLGIGAYVLFFIDQRRNPVDIAHGVSRDYQDRVEEGSADAISPGVSMGGIHVSFERRSRWRKR